jgi:hypothetical protein
MPVKTHTNISGNRTIFNPVFNLLRKFINHQPDNTDILLALATLEKPEEDDIDILLALSTLDNNVFGNITQEDGLTGEIIAYDWDPDTHEIKETTVKHPSKNNPYRGKIRIEEIYLDKLSV